MPNAYISGTGFYAPPRVVTNDDLRTMYGIDTSDDWIEQRTGIEERRFADEGVGCSDLAAAGVGASDRTCRPPEDRHRHDHLLHAVARPLLPGHGRLPCSRSSASATRGASFPCMDIRNQCSGFLYGLSTASALVRSGAHKHVLLGRRRGPLVRPRPHHAWTHRGRAVRRRRRRRDRQRDRRGPRRARHCTWVPTVATPTCSA